jgi:hypothetical protein
LGQATGYAGGLDWWMKNSRKSSALVYGFPFWLLPLAEFFSLFLSGFGVAVGWFGPRPCSGPGPYP